VRPTADRVKEALFNLLGVRWDETSVLDLFAGSGALGIEALSRGARQAIFVERERRCLEILRENIRACAFGERARVIQGDAVRFLLSSRCKKGYGVIFADPPYGKGLARACVVGLDKGGWLAPEGCFVVEHSRWEGLPEEGQVLMLLDQRSYGDTKLSVFGRKSSGGEGG
jgi:16S rRNA (guanine(966)-N(2))-methyltransferase RsmD